MATITIHVTQPGRRAGEILAGVADQLGAPFGRLDRDHCYFSLNAPPKRAYAQVRAAFDAVSKDWYFYFVINRPDG